MPQIKLRKRVQQLLDRAFEETDLKAAEILSFPIGTKKGNESIAASHRAWCLAKLGEAQFALGRPIGANQTINTVVAIQTYDYLQDVVVAVTLRRV